MPNDHVAHHRPFRGVPNPCGHGPLHASEAQVTEKKPVVRKRIADAMIKSGAAQWDAIVEEYLRLRKEQQDEY